MLERGIATATVTEVLLSGEFIEDYPEGTPYPSGLFLGFREEEPFHVVAALDGKSGYCFVVTAYRPGLEHFEADYKTRRVQ